MDYAVIKNKATYQSLQLFSIVLLPWGLFFSEAMTSILIILFAVPLLFFGAQLDRKAVLDSWPFFTFYGLLLISGFWSRDTGQWFNLLITNLPYVFIPMAFALWPQVFHQRKKLFLRQFIFAGIAISIYLMGYSLVNSEEVLRGLREGGSFEMPVHHVRTSLFMAIAGVIGWDEWIRHRWGSAKSRGFGLGLIFIIIGIHLLAVRTGLVLFYLGTIITFIWNSKFHQKQGYATMALFGFLIIIALATLPTIGEKWRYFLDDFRHYDSTSWWFYSDAVRWQSNVIGWELFKSAPWWGIGMGDIYESMHLLFYERDGIRIHEYPHNLWITFLAGTGIIGFIILNLILGRIGLWVFRKSSLMYGVLFLLFMLSCLVENTLLTSLGSSCFVAIHLFAMRVGQRKEE